MYVLHTCTNSTMTKRLILLNQNSFLTCCPLIGRMDSPMKKLWQSARKSSFLKYGVPMLILVVGGSFGLKEFRTLRYEIIDKRRKVDPETEAEYNPRRKNVTVTVEEEFKKLQDKDIDNWHNIRGPRPWENSKEFQEMLREHHKEDEIRAQKVWKKPSS